MTIQTTTQKAAETAHNVAEGVFDKASETLQSTRRMTNESIDKAAPWSAVEGSGIAPYRRLSQMARFH